MIDKGRVIDHLKIIATWAAVGKNPIYRGIEPKCCEDVERWVMDAINLLKKQEPVEPITDGNEHIHVFRCRKCNRILQRNNEMDYCPKCGQAVKWK